MAIPYKFVGTLNLSLFHQKLYTLASSRVTMLALTAAGAFAPPSWLAAREPGGSASGARRIVGEVVLVHAPHQLL